MKVTFLRSLTHLSTEPARRDDLEAIGYILAYLYTGDLPWRRFEKNLEPDRILHEKLQILPHNLCPTIPQVGWMIAYARALQYEQRPDYLCWESLWANLAPRGDCQYHFDLPCKFEWERR